MKRSKHKVAARQARAKARLTTELNQQRYAERERARRDSVNNNQKGKVT